MTARRPFRGRTTRAEMTAMLRFERLLGVILIVTGFAWSLPAYGQPFFPRRFAVPGGATQPLSHSLTSQIKEADNVARSHLERVDKFLDNQQWDEAIDTLRQVMKEDSDATLRVVVTEQVSGQRFDRFVTLRDACQMCLASMSRDAPEALAYYRRQVDPLAQRWLEEAIAANEAQRFEQIVDRLFLSSFGDDAALRLGDLRLAAGQFTAARSLWERISPLLRFPRQSENQLDGRGDLSLWRAVYGVQIEQAWDVLQPLLTDTETPRFYLAFPDTDLDLATVRARLVLVSILEGASRRAEIEWEIFRRLHPESAGELAGKRGKLVDLLAELLEQSRQWPPLPPSENWPTFAGSWSRNGQAATAVDPALRPIWSRRLPNISGEKDLLTETERRIGERRGELLSYFPLKVGDAVILQTGTEVKDILAVDLQTGRDLWPGTETPGADDADRTDRLAAALPEVGVRRYTLSADGHVLFAKLGPQASGLRVEPNRDPPQPGYLAALDLDAQKKRLLEIRLDDQPWGAGWAFEGPPVVDGAMLYVMLRRRENARSQSHVACFELHSNRAKLRWRRMLVAAESPGQGQYDEYTNNLLTLDQGILYANTNLGVIASLRASDGDLRWLVRYERSPLEPDEPDATGRHYQRDLNPCLVFLDRVVAAPADTDRIFALDAATGTVLWSTRPAQTTDVMHLLGAADGKLVATGDRVYWFDLETGQMLRRFPDRVQQSLRGFGRGVLAGDNLYWPTLEKIFVFDHPQMALARQPIELSRLGLTGGNLLIADDVLLVATSDRLVAFNEYGLKLD